MHHGDPIGRFLLGAAVLPAAAVAIASPPEVILAPAGAAEAAPHGHGNVYAPEVLVEEGRFRMWYGAQGQDGHDRICLAESVDGVAWERKGVVIDHQGANHVNDPSVVKVGDTLLMYYTRAGDGVRDVIALATSDDGVTWTDRGTVLRPGPEDAWDSLLVGRPSVLVENGRYRMWYDGRKDLPPEAPAGDAPTSKRSTRAVGYAESGDGFVWTRPRAEPVFGHNAGGVHVVRMGAEFAMAWESRDGTRLATSPDGLDWRDHGLIAGLSGDAIDRFGHVTPFLSVHPASDTITLFTGAARSAAWNENCIVRMTLGPSRPPWRDSGFPRSSSQPP